MRAVLLTEDNGQPQQLFSDIGKPEPGEREVCVRIHASALNRRDYWITKGLYPGIKYGCVMGSDAAGVIESVGKQVDKGLLGREVVIYPVFEWGDDPQLPGKDFRILGMPENGTFADYICVPLENIQSKPAHLSMQEAAALPLAAVTAWRALVTKAGIKQGETLLITGIGGGVACMALTLAVKMGCRVIVTSSSKAKIAAANTQGAIAGFLYTQEGWDETLRSGHGGVDVIIDGNCGPQFNPCFKSMNPGGRYIIYGFTQGQPAAGFDASRLFFRQLRIEGTTMASPQEFRAMLEFVSDKQIHPVVDKVFPLEDAVSATTYLGQGSQMGKIVFDHLA